MEGRGSRRSTRRRGVDAILYLARTRCRWRYLPLRVKVRQADDRKPEPTAGLTDSQSVRSADTVSRVTTSFNAGKKTLDRKRFIITAPSACPSLCPSWPPPFKTMTASNVPCYGPAPASPPILASAATPSESTIRRAADGVVGLAW